MKNCITIICLLIWQYSFSQTTGYNIQKTFSVKEVLQDIDYTEKYLCKFHPDPYRYISKDSLHRFVENVKSRINKPLTEQQTRFYIKQIIAQIGCGHSEAAASKAYTKAVVKVSKPTLPLNVFITNDKRVYVLNNLSSDTTLKAGDEIVSINNKPIRTILDTIFSIYTSDGYNTTYKQQGIKNDWFKYYYSFCFGYKTIYSVETINSKGITSSRELLCGSSLKDTLILPPKEKRNYLKKTKTCRYYIDSSANNMAVIDIDAFKGLGWRRFFRKSFKDIKQKHISNLVIDLRDNGGGRIGYGLYTLSYLLRKPVVLPFDRPANLMALNPRFKTDIFSRLTPLAFCTVMPQWIVKGRLRHYFIRLPKHRLAYKGNIIVLTNGKSFSMSGVVASYLKYNANATVIGEETGGNVAGSNAVISGNVVLPNTKIRVIIPVYHIYHKVKTVNNGHGVMPNYPTQYTKDDYLNGVDVDLNKAKELIK